MLDNGLNLESWFAKFVEESHAKHVTVSEGVTPISITEDAYAGKPNPHAWMSPSNVQKYVDVMIREFSALDPSHAADYKTRGEATRSSYRACVTSSSRKSPPCPRTSAHWSPVKVPSPTWRQTRA